MKGFLYILECSDGSYYTGSTKELELRLAQHQAGEGANHTKKRLPVKLVYYEEFSRIDEAFYREKQVQGWSRKKKEALIGNRPEDLPLLSKNHTQYPKDFMISMKDEVPEPSVSEPSVPEPSVPEPSAPEPSVPEPSVPEPVEGTTNKIQNNLKELRYEKQ
ncbi:GIY-YIG nuclease family protein [Gelidibacter sp.]|uniref:GIY-YIG nuclease family protein n=1 Tax=Gelidibacter sp. TaxID=2018083 RepID=UPI002BA330C2|nr:GIY-YIG nuclease family protein [Gelidibacter sp.]HUH26735.1 GIY-YIG nuclease family protein [Gelidibacter sp.]